MTRFGPNFKGKVKARSGQGKGRVKTMSRQDQGKVKSSSRQGKDKVSTRSSKAKVRLRQGQGKIKARIIIHSASADLSAEMPKNRLIKLKIILKHSRML